MSNVPPSPSPPWLRAATDPTPTVLPPPPPPVVDVKPGLRDSEPVALAGALQGLLAAVAAVLVGFNVWHPTDAQIGLLMGLYAALVAVATAWSRGRAWSPASVAQLHQKAGQNG